MSRYKPPRVVLPATPEPEPFADLPEVHTSPGISPQQIVAIMLSHWRRSLTICLTIIVVTFVVVKLWPPSYTATATLMVDSNMKDTLAGQEFQEGALYSFIATQSELMLSPIVLGPVIDRLNLVDDRDFSGRFSQGDNKALRDYIENKLAANIEVTSGRGQHLMYISTTNRSPVTAANLVNAVAEVYLDQEHKRVNDPAGERAQRYSEQLAELRAKAAAAQDKVAEFRKANGITEVTSSTTGTETQALENLEQKLLEAQSVRRAIESKGGGNTSTTDEALASQPVQALRAQVGAQEAQLAQLNSTLGPKHPKVLELKSQMAVTRRALAAEVQNLTANVSTQLSRAKELEAKLTAAVAEQRVKVLHLRELQDQGAKLTLELESAQSVYKRALDGYDQILFASVGNYSHVTFVNHALPPLRASKPNKFKLFVLGILAGIAAGLAGPLLYDLFLDRRVRCVDDVEREFGIPVLARLLPLPSWAGAP